MFINETCAGDTVNTAARMEKYGTPGHIHFTEDTLIAARLSPDHPSLTQREIEVKGKGMMKTYLISEAGASKLFKDF